MRQPIGIAASCRDMRDMIALRSFALGVAADEPELVGDACGQRAKLDDGDGGGRRRAGQFGGAAGRFAIGSQRRRMIGQGRQRSGSGRRPRT